MLLSWLWQHLHVDNNNWCHPSKVCLCHIHDGILYLSQCITSERHYREGGIYETMRQHICWPHRANDVYTFVRQCRSYTRNGSQMMCKQKPQPLSSRIHWVRSRWFLGPLLRTRTGNKHLEIITYRCSKLTQEIPKVNINSTQSDNILEQEGHTIWDILDRIDQQ